MRTDPFEYEVMRELNNLKEMVAGLQEQITISAKNKPAEKSDGNQFITIKQLKARWKCKDTTAYNFAHRRGSGAKKIKHKILIPIKEIEAYERNSGIRTG